MGILDAVLNQWGQWSQDPNQNRANDAYLNALAAGLLSGRSNNFGVNLGRAMGGAQGAMGEEQDRIMKSQLIGAQMKNYEAEAEHRKAAADAQRMSAMQAQNRASILSRVGQPGPEAQAQPQAGMDFGAMPTSPRPGSSRIDQRMVAEYLASGGKIDDLKSLAESGQWGVPKVARTIKFVRDGKEFEQQFDDFGNPIGGPIEQAMPLHFQEIGGAVRPLNKLTGAKVGEDIQKTPTIAELETARHNPVMERAALTGAGAAAAQAQTAANRLNYDINNPTLNTIQTEGGFAVVPGRAPAGQVPTVSPLKDATGTQVRPKDNTPQYVIEGLATNGRTIATIDDALKKLKTPEGQNATGFKANLPGQLLNRYDPAGVETRAAIADVGSLQIKDRTGATVTVSEQPRLMPFVPLPTDDADTVQKKLVRLRKAIDDENKVLGAFFPRAAETAKAASDAPQAGKQDRAAIITEAKNALLRNAPRAKVIQRLESMGITDHGL